MTSKVNVINNFVEVYRTFAGIPLPISGEILSLNNEQNSAKILSNWKQRSIERGEIIKFQRHHIINLNSGDIIFESTPTDNAQEILSGTSKTGKYYCAVKKFEQENKKKTFIEIWDQNGLYKNFNVYENDIHGDIYEDGEFGSLEWSPCENKLIYVAEKKNNKTEPFYKQNLKGKCDEMDKKNEEEIFLGDEYLYKPDWGEQLVNKHQPVICICDINSETIKVLSSIPSNFSPGQVLWSRDGNGIFGVAYENEPRRMGLISCTNRTSFIFYVSLDGKFSLLSDENKSVRSPRLSLDGSYLVWLQRNNSGVHNGCHELVRLDLKTKEKEILIDTTKKGNTSFSGLYMHDLPSRCFSKNGLLFFSTLHKFKIVSYYLNLEDKSIHQLKTKESSTILDVYDDMILISASEFQQSPALKISKFVRTDMEWIPITKSKSLCEKSVVQEIEFESTYQSDNFSYYNALYYGPPMNGGPKETTPLIVYPHGGPHAAVFNDFSLEFNFFVSIGYGILAVNYRGSLGVGQDGVDFLQGNLGNTDVIDIHEAVLKLLEMYPCLSKKNIFLYGKSYGGFLVSQLSARYPDFYRAVVNCNGVSDVISMYTTSDIPDWSTAECGLCFDETKPLTLDEVTKMVLVSPMQLVEKIKAPTFFAVGKKDLRVPCFQGISLYNALKARQVKVRLNLYDSNHSLGKVPVHFDYVINAALWFWEHKA